MRIQPFDEHLISVSSSPTTDEEEPVRTKVVATLGGPQKYQKQYQEEKYVYNLDGQKVDLGRLTYESLVREFYDNGVDVLRLNFSHLLTEGARQVFPVVKKALLARENHQRPPKRRDPRNWNPKRMAVLADLPGPKIRFPFGKRKEAVSFDLGQDFTVSFATENSGSTAYPVEVDKHSLREALGSEYTKLMSAIRSRLEKGQQVLVFIGDGDVILEVQLSFSPDKPLLPCKVISVAKPGEAISENKGFTLKGIDLDIPTFTPQDKEILEELLKQEYEGYGQPDWQPVLAFVALSFAQSANDVLRARWFMEKKIAFHAGIRGQDTRLLAPSIIAKIETNRGVESRDDILDVADGAMVARGDLGLQVDIEEVPAIQKRLIRLCNERGKPVITATQMLASMTRSVEPTRAEVTDVFNAILDGTDAVMTSEETAIGSYPWHTLRKMLSIAEKAEQFFEYKRAKTEGAMGQPEDEERRKRRFQRVKEIRRQRVRDFLRNDALRIGENEERLRAEREKIADKIRNLRRSATFLKADAQEIEWLTWCQDLYDEKVGKASDQETTNRITEAACTMAEAESARAILAATASGRTVRMIARIRPRVIIIGAAHDEINTRKLQVSYGVLPILIGMLEQDKGTEDIFKSCMEVIRWHGFLDKYLKPGHKVIFTAGFPLQKAGTTNLVQIREIDGD